MNQVINTLVTGLLVHSLIVSSSAGSDNGSNLAYRVTSYKVFNLGPNSSKTYMSVNATVYLQPENTLGNILSLVMKDVRITVQNENSEVINVDNCLSKETATALESTFLGVFDSNGALSHILVDKNEPELSVNIKLFGTSLLQINREQVQKLSPQVSRRSELFYAGSCPTESMIVNKENPISIQKLEDLSKCSEVTNDHRSDSLTCLKNTCRPSQTQNLQWKAKSNTQIAELNGQIAIRNFVFNESINYIPFEKSNAELTFYTRIEIDLIGITQNVISPFVKENSITMSRPVYPSVNKNICENNDNTNIQLKKLYCALICKQPFAVFYEEIVEKAITCNKVH